MWLYSGKVALVKGGCIREKVVVFGRHVSNRAKRLCSGKSGFIRVKWLYLLKSGSNRAKVVVFGQSGCNPHN